ncbi:MAG: hypothetical protein E6K54_07130 [Gammaproteobacteria bacterium]|nr:MAG: hypothetical protein E6K54_07130 [Gammaproteobacteria bacterium]
MKKAYNLIKVANKSYNCEGSYKKIDRLQSIQPELSCCYTNNNMHTYIIPRAKKAMLSRLEEKPNVIEEICPTKWQCQFFRNSTTSVSSESINSNGQESNSFLIPDQKKNFLNTFIKRLFLTKEKNCYTSENCNDEFEYLNFNPFQIGF